jgi:hypothetical protein
MTVREWYQESILGKHHSLKLLIEFLVFEKKVVKFEDDTEKITYYLQDRFKNKMNQHLQEYEVKRNEQTQSVG